MQLASRDIMLKHFVNLIQTEVNWMATCKLLSTIMAKVQKMNMIALPLLLVTFIP